MSKDIELTPDLTIQTELQEESGKQVTVHVSYHKDSMIRIWKCIILVDKQSGGKAKLIQAYGVGIYPNWTFLKKGQYFSLVFEGLPKSCTSFDLIEKIPQPGGFIRCGIQRNKSDVYKLSL